MARSMSVSASRLSDVDDYLGEGLRIFMRQVSREIARLA
jgi:hypothetical protein